MPSYDFPPPPASMEPTSLERCDALVNTLNDGKQSWADLGLDGRIQLLDQLLHRVHGVAERWVKLGQQAKGLDPDHPWAGEEWLAGPMITCRNIRLLRESLAEVRDKGAPVVDPSKVSQRADGRLTVEVFPQNLLDKLMFAGFRAEVWLDESVKRDNLQQAKCYKEGLPPKVSLVLGAGNVSSIPPMDALYKLFVENQVVVLKMNPVNEYLGPLFEEAFMPLVEKGWFGVVYGGAEVGAHLCQHEGVHTIHITGSDATHDAIVWGPREGREERKAKGEKALDKPISSELGNVTPIIVVPGKWKPSELAFQAENVATMVANNGSFNCNAGKLLVLDKDWPQRQAFMDEIRKVLASLPNRKAYYPGARDRWKTFTDAHPNAEVLTADDENTVPWTLIPGLDHTDEDEMCFRVEPFCAVLHEVSLPAGGTADAFLAQATEFCNERVWGTLAAMMLIDPRTQKASSAAYEKALDDLRYGGLAINHWAALNYGLVVTTWGAYPGHSLEDIQSGRDVVHNTQLFDKPNKSIIYGPFTMSPKPPWFATNKRTHKIAPLLCEMEVAPSYFKLPGIVMHSLMG